MHLRTLQRRRPALFIAAFTYLTFASAARQAHCETAPNILIILSDDHSAPHVGCYGNSDVHTPVLDELSKVGIRFSRAYVTAPQCVPSRASIMSGGMPLEIGVRRFSDNLQPNIKTIPEYLKPLGYYTGLCGRNYHLDGSIANDPIFRDLIGPNERPTMARRVDYCRMTELPDETIDQLNEFLDKKPAEKPFFLQLCWSDPHRDWDNDPKPNPVDPSKLRLPITYPDTAEVRQDLAQYYDEINRMDANTGRALKVLRKRGLYENTIVIFMGDNGASQFRGKGTLNELGLWVPLVIRMPGNAQAGTVVKTLVSCEDILPTLLDVLRLDVPPELSGKSFAAALQGKSLKERDYVFAERMAHGGLPINSGAFDLGRAIIGKKYKLIYNCTWQLPYYPIDFGEAPFFKSLRRSYEHGELSALHARLYFGSRSMFEMYDLEADPLELNNLAGMQEFRSVEDELRKELSAQMIRNHDFLPPPVPNVAAK